jgi:hypothetical protein
LSWIVNRVRRFLVNSPRTSSFGVILCIVLSYIVINFKFIQ